MQRETYPSLRLPTSHHIPHTCSSTYKLLGAPRHVCCRATPLGFPYLGRRNLQLPRIAIQPSSYTGCDKQLRTAPLIPLDPLSPDLQPRLLLHIILQVQFLLSIIAESRDLLALAHEFSMRAISDYAILSVVECHAGVCQCFS